MLNTLYSGKETHTYAKMVRLLMYGGKKDKALSIFFAVLSKIFHKLEEKSPGPFRRYRLYDKGHSANHLKCLGLKAQSPMFSAASNPSESLQMGGNHLQPIGREPQKTLSIEKTLNTFQVLQQGVQNVQPYLEVRKVRVSGKTRQVPSMIGKKRQQTLGLRWLIEAARNRKKQNMTFADSLALEFLDAFEKQGGARQKRNEFHKIAHANRTFLRYRWW